MFCNDCLAEAKTKTRTENESEREKTQARIPNNTACLSLWFGSGAVRTEVFKFPQVFPAAVFQEKAYCWGCWHEEESRESAEECTPTFPVEGNCLSLSVSVTSCFSHASCFIENRWIINWAATTSQLRAAFLPLFYKMPLTSKCKSLEPVSRRLKRGRGITQYYCALLTPFLWHIQYRSCAQFSLIPAGYWKSWVPELTSSLRGLGKRGKIDIVGLCVDVQFCCSQAECIHLWKWHFFTVPVITDEMGVVWRPRALKLSLTCRIMWGLSMER